MGQSGIPTLDTIAMAATCHYALTSSILACADFSVGSLRTTIQRHNEFHTGAAVVYTAVVAVLLLGLVCTAALSTACGGRRPAWVLLSARKTGTIQ